MMPTRILSRAVVSGGVAGVTSTLALGALALSEGKGAAQPLNATSHWLRGAGAAAVADGDAAHTLVGLGTHLGATVFWACLFEAWLVVRPAREPARLVRRAAAVAALAATVDYTITPRRFTPGWELVMSKRAMALVYAALAAGLAATALGRRPDL